MGQPVRRPSGARANGSGHQTCTSVRTPAAAESRFGKRLPGTSGGMRPRRAVLWPAALGLAISCTACEPHNPDRSAWRDQAWQGVNQVAGDVATASLVLHELEHQRIMRNYAKVMMISAERDTSDAADKISADQPQPADQSSYQRVTTTLTDAGDVLAQARIVVVRRHVAAYSAMQHRLTKETAALNKLESALGGLRG